MYKGLKSSKTCAVFVSDKTPRGWVNEEITQALVLHNKRAKFRIIPVLLPNAKIVNVKNFLDSRTYVQFINNLDEPEPLHQLISGIKGSAPGRREKITKNKEIAVQSAGITVLVEVKIVLGKDFDSFDEEEKKNCLDRLSQILGNQPLLKSITKGSVILTLELSAGDLEKLKDAIKLGLLDDLKIRDLIITTNRNSEVKPDSKQLSLKEGSDNLIIPEIPGVLAFLKEKHRSKDPFINQLSQATSVVSGCLQAGKKVLFVTSQVGVKDVVKQVARQISMPSVTINWRKGMLFKEMKRVGINERTIAKPLKKSKLMKYKKSGSISLLHSHHRNYIKRFAGNTTFLPGAMVLVYPSLEINALIEANKMRVPVIGIGTVQKLDGRVDYPIIIKHPTTEIVEKILLHLIQTPSYIKQNKKDKPQLD